MGRIYHFVYFYLKNMFGLDTGCVEGRAGEGVREGTGWRLLKNGLDRGCEGVRKETGRREYVEEKSTVR